MDLSKSLQSLRHIYNGVIYSRSRLEPGTFLMQTERHNFEVTVKVLNAHFYPGPLLYIKINVLKVFLKKKLKKTNKKKRKKRTKTKQNRKQIKKNPRKSSCNTTPCWLT